MVAIFTPRDVAQLGSAQRSGRWGRRFKSCHPDFIKKLNIQCPPLEGGPKFVSIAANFEVG